MWTEIIDCCLDIVHSGMVNNSPAVLEAFVQGQSLPPSPASTQHWLKRKVKSSYKSDDVVPFGTDRVTFQIELLHLGL